MEEIVVIQEAASTSQNHGNGNNGKKKPVSTSSKRQIPRSRTVGYVPEPFDSEKLPPTLASDIRPFLRVANQIELEWPSVASLCRFHAFERAHIMDPSSSGRGVRQFKTSLLQRLEQDEKETISKRAEGTNSKRKEETDLHQLKRAYLKFEDYIRRHGGDSDKGEQLNRACTIAHVLSEVLRTLTTGTGVEIIADTEDNESKSEFYQRYNILPLDPGGEHQAIMQLPEIKAALTAIRNIRGLPAVENHQRLGANSDVFDWLQCSFGFQKGNVSNQREHLILLLANIHIRQCHESTAMSKLGEKPVNDLMKSLFRNYKRWCRFLGRRSNIWLPPIKLEEQQYKMLYIALYLLIWGEASNLRFMPECLCYIFHHMAYELHSLLSGAVSQTTGERLRPAYGGEAESFLNKVVTPIYWVIYKEAEKNKSGTADHSEWRNYDDLNEYFWSPVCFQLGWPLRLDHDFFYVPSPGDRNVSNDKESEKENISLHETPPRMEQFQIASTPPITESSPLIWKDQFEDSTQVNEEKEHVRKWLGKNHFVEIRSFWQLFRSFDRMWIFFILALQAMIIMAWHELDYPFQLFDKAVFEDITSIFITSAALKVIQALLDLAFVWNVRHNMDYYQMVRYILKPVAAAAWTIILPVFYADSRRNSRCSVKQSGSWIGEWCISSYMVVVAFYMASNAMRMVLFLVPTINKFLETSTWSICTIFSWWSQPRLYVGRGMQENLLSLLKYTLFWVLLLLSKLSFSYYYEIIPLVQPTKRIMKIGLSAHDWHELFPKVKSNAGAIVAVWAPILLVYFMDTQIWYSVFCAVFGGVYGVFRHLGEIRTMGMLRSKFQSLAYAFNVYLVPPSSKHAPGKTVRSIFKQKPHKVPENEKRVVAKFSHVWNQIISSFRSEDLISNREMDLMTIPISLELSSGRVQWPVFLLATKFSTALSMARDFVGTDEKLLKKIRKDNFMYLAVKECYESLKYILEVLVVGELEKRIISEIISEIETSISNSSFLVDFKMSQLPDLHHKFIELVNLLVENQETAQEKVVKVLQDIFEIVMQDMMIDGSKLSDSLYCNHPLEIDTGYFKDVRPQLFASFKGEASILFPLPDSGPLKDQIKRLYLLLTVKGTSTEIPVNLEARRRISFFSTSLFMGMPFAPKVHNMLSFSVMTPHFMEDVNFSNKELHWSKDGVPIMFYMQKMYPDEWKNFLERTGCENVEDINSKGKDEDLRKWASFRGQTLSRTVRGMMYYRKAIKLQAFLDMAGDDDIFEDYNFIERINDRKNGPHSLNAQLDALADIKFTYVIACQTFGAQKASGSSHAQDIIDLLIRYPSLRVAYIEEKEEIGTRKPQTIYSSILVKAVNNLEEEIYRIKLPGPPNIGEGKPENQNNAIVFTRGDALQTIDMNQDNYIEEAFKMRNILQEFLHRKDGQHPTIIGLRENIFTGSVSSLAWFMSYQETSFVTIGQRILANPLRVRFHYGHPDIFDRIFHITRGGISKASKTINLSEDVFAGFNSVLRQGCVTYQEYMQVGKGRDVGLNQISQFEAKIANGNSEQSLSRDIFRLGRRFDFFRMLSCYFTTVGFYFSSLLSVLGIYVFLYGQLYLVLSGLEKAILLEARMQSIESLETSLASQSFIQLGLLTGLPMVIEIGLEKGFLAAFQDFVLMQLQLAAVFFTFSLGTKSHYYGRTILHGGAKYRTTGRKVVVFHASFTENYRLYSRSHFVKGFELVLLLIVYDMFRKSYQSSMTYVLITYSIWFMAATWLFAPFLFNPSGFDWGKIVDDWVDWNKWVKNQGGIGVQQEKSWESWWKDEQAHLRRCGLSARIIEILLSLRFFIYQYGMVYHLDISKHNKNFLVYVLSWLVLVLIFILTKAMTVGRILLASNYQLSFRFLKALLFLGALSIIISLSLVCDLSLMDLIVGSLAFLPTGWGLILIAQAVRPKIDNTGLWDFVQVLAQAYDCGMGVALFAPIAALAWLPIVSAFQTRFLFNEAFNRRLQILTILAGKKKPK